MSVRRVILKSGFNGDDSVRNVFTVNDTGSEPTMGSYNDWMHEVWHTGLLAEISDTWAATAIVEEVPSGGLWSYAREIAVTDIVGAATDDLLPRQSAPVIIGLVPGRRRGKKFIAGFCEGSQSDGQLDIAAKAALLVAGVNWIDPATSVPGSAFLAGVCKPDGTDFVEFNATRVDPIIGSQRRRKQGVGQ